MAKGNYGFENSGVSQSILQGQNNPINALLIDIATDICDRLRDGLVKYNVNTSSLGLSQSIIPGEIELNGNELSVSISSESYWKFINYGVNGTEVNHGAPAWGKQPKSGKSFHQSILEWIPKRGVMLPDAFKSYDSFAWAIQKNIEKKGKQPRPFFTEVVNQSLNAQLLPRIIEIFGREIELNITQPWQ